MLNCSGILDFQSFIQLLYCICKNKKLQWNKVHCNSDNDILEIYKLRTIQPNIGFNNMYKK